MLADNEDASGESEGATENENLDTGALQKEKQHLRGLDCYCWWGEMLCVVLC